MSATEPDRSWVDRVRLPTRLSFLLVLLFATLHPFRLDPDAERVLERLSHVLHPSLDRRDVVDAARNLVLFAGWGAIWALSALGRARRVILEATLSGAVISIAVEIAQLFSSNRNSSLLDVTTNSLGAFSGALVVVLAVVLTGQRRNARSFVGMPTALFAGCYGAAVWLEAFSPLFRQNQVLGAVGGPFHRLAVSLGAIDWSTLTATSWTDLPLFLPAGTLMVAGLAEHGMDHSLAARRTSLAGGLLAVLAELLHGALGQPIIIGAVLLHTAAVAAGARIAARALPRLTVALRGGNRPRVLYGTYLAVLTAWSWRPFLPEIQWHLILHKFSGPWYIPLAALAERMDFFSVVDVCAPFLMYLPLGALLAVWPWKKQGLLRGPLPGVWVALGLELGQTVVLGRLPDITDVMIHAGGVLIGWAIMRRAAYPIYGTVLPLPRFGPLAPAGPA